MKRIAVLSLLALAGCAKATAIPIAANMVRISADAAPVCGASGAQGVAGKQAAKETLKRGYDSYVIADAQEQQTKEFSFDSYGGGTRTNHNQSLLVKMFRNGEPGSQNAIDARQQLGPDWKKIASEDALSCF